ncbi:MAG: response regulator transcription factor, partial [Acidobacteria bacterium]|nr:response regulator transcription factor [Acidobacteriota bacterium]
MPSSQPDQRRIRVLVADNSVIHTELLADAIAKDRRISIDLSTSCKGVLETVVHSVPDVLLISDMLDQRPGAGLELLREMRRTLHDLKAIVLLDSSTQENVIQAFRAGARGIFCRNQPVKKLCKCILMVSEGQIWANTTELSFLVELVSTVPSICPATTAELAVLSDRERDVVKCLAEGLSNREIATRLAISQHTVKNYMFRIFEKLGVSSRVELLFQLLSRTGQVQETQNPATMAKSKKAVLAPIEIYE